ncbi:MAG TPA: hypothetical protein DEA45_01510 [Acholeplasmataceae bacterium]|nr:hypothetical protein [Acholeplasmataceae bacterium]
MVVILAILGTSIFFFTFNSNYSDMLHMVNLKNVEKGQSINLMININPRESNNTVDQFLQDTYDFVMEVGLPASVMYSVSLSDSKHTLRSVFITSNNDLISHVYLREEVDFMDVLSRPDWHITNNSTNGDAFIIDYLDSYYYQFDSWARREISIRPIENLLDDFSRDVGQIVVTVVVDSENLEQVKTHMGKVYEPYKVITPIIYTISQMDQLQFQEMLRTPPLITTLFTLPYSIMWLSVLCALFISIYVSVKQSKEIVIGYLHGYDKLTIFQKFFIPYIAKSSLTFVVTVFITTLVLSSSYGALYFEFIKSLLPFLIIYFGLMLLCIIATYLWISYRFSSQILKERKQLIVIYGLVSILRVGLIAILAIPLLNEMSDIRSRLPYLDFYRNHNHLTEGIVLAFSGMNQTINQDELLLKEDIRFYVNNQTLGYANFDDYYMNSFRSTDNPLDNFYTTESEIVLPKHPYVIVNQRFLNDYTGRITEYTEDIVVLMPEGFRDKRESEIVKGQSVQLEFYSEDLLMVPYFETGVERVKMGILENPIIIVDPDPVKTSFAGRIVDFSGQELIRVAVELEEKYPTKFYYGTVQSSVDRNILEQNRSISRFFQLLVLYISLVSIFLITATGLFFSSFGKEVSILYMNGQNYLMRYHKLSLSNLLVIVSSFTILFVSLSRTIKFDIASYFGLLLLTMLIEACLVIGSIYMFERKSIPIIIKGDD